MRAEGEDLGYVTHINFKGLILVIGVNVDKLDWMTQVDSGIGDNDINSSNSFLLQFLYRLHDQYIKKVLPGGEGDVPPSHLLSPPHQA
jgi:hypothetical protein